jgi:hypothetical protein
MPKSAMTSLECSDLSKQTGTSHLSVQPLPRTHNQGLGRASWHVQMHAYARRGRDRDALGVVQDVLGLEIAVDNVMIVEVDDGREHRAGR